MQVVILCGGKATRLGSLAYNVPKSLQPILDKTFLDFQIAIFKKQGFTKFHFCLGHLGKKIEEHINEKYSKEEFSFTFSYDPPNSSGTLCALVNACNYLNDEFMLTYGDTILPIDYSSLMSAYASSNHEILMTIYKNNNNLDKSNIEVISGKAFYRGLHYNQCKYIDYGLFCLNKDFLLSTNTAVQGNDVSDLLLSLSNDTGIEFLEVYKPFYEIGTPGSLIKTETLIREELKNEFF